MTKSLAYELPRRIADAVLGIALLSVAGCSSSPFDPTNDWHCALAFRDSMQAASSAGNDALAKNMSFRAEWAKKRAIKQATALPPKEHMFKAQEYISSSAKAGTETTIACRRRQNEDPGFPKGSVL